VALARGTILAFGWRVWEELRRTPVMIASVPAKNEVGIPRIQVTIPLQPTNMLKICIRQSNYLIRKYDYDTQDRKCRIQQNDRSLELYLHCV